MISGWEQIYREFCREYRIADRRIIFKREMFFFPDIFIKSFLNCLRNETDKDAEGDGFDIVNKHCEWTIRKVDDIALGFDRD